MVELTVTCIIRPEFGCRCNAKTTQVPKSREKPDKPSLHLLGVSYIHVHNGRYQKTKKNMQKKVQRRFPDRWRVVRDQ